MRRDLPSNSIMFELYEFSGNLKFLSGEIFLSRVEDVQCHATVKTVSLPEKRQPMVQIALSVEMQVAYVAPRQQKAMVPSDKCHTSGL